MRVAVRLASVIAVSIVIVCANAAPVAHALIPAVASRGARATIVGAGLDSPDLAINFSAESGWVQASVMTRTATHLDLRVPAMATSGPVRLVSGETTIGTFQFTVTADRPFVRVRTIASGLAQPAGTAVSLSDGSLYMVDRNDHVILAIDSDGIVQRFAGTGKPGNANGAALAASFRHPEGVAIDNTRGFVYVADTGNHVIRRIGPGGDVITLAGSGSPEDRDGRGTGAGLKEPRGIAIDADGVLYVTDSGNHKIRRVTPDGEVTTFAGAGRPGFGDGPSAHALFRSPAGIAIDPAGGVIVADTQNHRVRRVHGGIVTTMGGTGHPGSVDGPAPFAEFHQPSDVAVDDAGDIYVADALSSRIRKIRLGVVSTIAGTGQSGLHDAIDPLQAGFHEPVGLALAGAIYITDSRNGALRVIEPAVIAADLYPRAGDSAGGVAVRIFGAGFLPGATAVMFGAQPATNVTFISATEIVATAPAGDPGIVNVTVMTRNGTAMLSGAWRYELPFTMLRISPAGSTVGVGETLSLKVFGVTATGTTIEIMDGVAWTSAAPAIADIDAQGLLTAYAPGTATIRATFQTLTATHLAVVSSPEVLPPDPLVVAPPLGGGRSTPLAEGLAFLYSGPNAVQTGLCRARSIPFAPA